jgi:hypothetical protein
MSKSPSRFSMSEKTTDRLKTFFIFLAVVLAVTALIYSVKNNNSSDSNKQNGTNKNKNLIRSNFSNNANTNSNNNANQYSMSNKNDWNSNAGGNTNKVYDGNDAANTINGGAAQSMCNPIATAEPAHPNLSSFSGAPTMYNAAVANSASYPDSTASQSLAGKTTYSCAPDITNVGGCDYAINPDNLMPGSWREGVSCSDGTDPNSQWAKYHPTRDKYYRYITAAGSARLGANTRSSSRKILGLQNPLRSGTSTPITNTVVAPFHESSLRAQAIFDSVGTYPESSHC